MLLYLVHQYPVLGFPGGYNPFKPSKMVTIHVAITALLAWSTVCAQTTDQDAGMPGAASFVVPSAFPTSVFSSYYVKPAATQEPQPALYDPVLNITYPLNLTNPNTIPSADTADPVYFPEAIANVSNATCAGFYPACGRPSAFHN